MKGRLGEDDAAGGVDGGGAAALLVLLVAVGGGWVGVVCVWCQAEAGSESLANAAIREALLQTCHADTKKVGR